jgi:hypothetical protein
MNSESLLELCKVTETFVENKISGVPSHEVLLRIRSIFRIEGSPSEPFSDIFFVISVNVYRPVNPA